MKRAYMYLFCGVSSPFLMFCAGIGAAREQAGLPTSPTWLWAACILVSSLMICYLASDAITQSEMNKYRKQYIEEMAKKK